MRQAHYPHLSEQYSLALRHLQAMLESEEEMTTTKLSDEDLNDLLQRVPSARYFATVGRGRIMIALTELRDSRAKLARVDGLVKALEFYRNAPVDEFSKIASAALEEWKK